MSTILNHPDGTVRVDETGGQRAIRVEPRNSVFTPIRKWITAYPLDLIEHVLRVKGAAYLCDEIMRDEYPLYVQHAFRWDILTYAGEEAFKGKRVLDFGSGSGASSMVLARMFPDAQIIGVELAPDRVELARHRAEFYGLGNRVGFRVSPDANNLPPDIGDFDFIVFSGVFEHLLPAERPRVLPLLWSHLNKDGIVFVDQLPYRWFPIELHTTGLPLINYLPDGLALAFARRFSQRMSRDVTWHELLRKGIRGGTPGELLGILNRDGREAELVQPSRLGVHDHIGLWHQLSSSIRQPATKKLMMWSFRGLRAITGVTMIPSLSLAIKKVR
jgi:SAM-dependent methyltransferase